MRPLVALLTLMVVSAGPASVRAQEAKLPKEFTNSIGMKLVRIPAGEFMMGNHDSPEALAKAFRSIERRRIDELVDEQPVHSVRITRPFLWRAHEVTIGEFKRFVKDAGFKTEAERDGTGGWGYNPDIKSFEGRQAAVLLAKSRFSPGERSPGSQCDVGRLRGFLRVAEQEGRQEVPLAD